MKAKNKIVFGYLKEFKFKRKYGKLYLRCLEKRFVVNKMTVASVQVIGFREYPSIFSVFMRSVVFSRLFGLLGLIMGVSTAKKHVIYTIKLTYSNGMIGLAEVNLKVYNLLYKELFDI